MRSSLTKHLFLLAGGSWIALSAWCQEPAKKLTARELFYAALDTQAPAPSPAKPAAPKAKPARPKTTPAATASQPQDVINQPPSGSVAPGRAPVIKAAYSGASGPPLGLRYSILKRTGDDQSAEVDADTLFHAGDRIRLGLEANTDGYLYVVNRGSSGTWKLLFPSPEIQGGDNRIKKRVKYEIPSGYTFTFDEQAGVEKLFIVFARQPEPNLEKLIYALGQGASGTAKAPQPAEDKPKMLLASAALSDQMVGKIRNAYARDLIIEKVDDAQPGPKKEKAVYTVNPSGSSDSRVVADVTLNHQ